jgi:sterol desaturase/sphingolipid hydroxylase (fatty acid hydroxylase superfamily)
MTEAEFQAFRAAGFALAVGLAVLLQRVTPQAGLRGIRSENFGLWVLNLAVMAAICGACACTASRWAAARHLGLLHAVALPGWAGVGVTIVALDFVSYAWHRANHVFPLLWRFHAVHHSDAHFTASTAVRFHPGELVLSLPLRLGAIVALGAPVHAVVAFEIVFAVANLIEHGNIALPARFERPAQRLLITPALHRMHHARTGPARDSNFGTILVVWDRLLGTCRENDSATRIDTGLPGIGGRPGLATLLLMPLRPDTPPGRGV